MTLPRAREARPYYRCAMQRYEDAEILVKSQRWSAAIYLAGYSVECVLKALILNSISNRREREEARRRFRGPQGHDFVWLRRELRAISNLHLPEDVNRHFVNINTWSVHLRYETKQAPPPRIACLYGVRRGSHRVGGWEDVIVSIEVRGKKDPIIETIADALQPFARDYPRARIVLYRQNSASVRIRIIDKQFARQSLPDRSDVVWKYLEKLPPNAQADVSMLLLLAPEEAKESPANLEFDDPLPSRF